MVTQCARKRNPCYSVSSADLAVRVRNPRQRLSKPSRSTAPAPLRTGLLFAVQPVTRNSSKASSRHVRRIFYNSSWTLSASAATGVVSQPSVALRRGDRRVAKRLLPRRKRSPAAERLDPPRIQRLHRFNGDSSAILAKSRSVVRSVSLWRMQSWAMRASMVPTWRPRRRQRFLRLAAST